MWTPKKRGEANFTSLRKGLSSLCTVQLNYFNNQIVCADKTLQKCESYSQEGNLDQHIHTIHGGKNIVNLKLVRYLKKHMWIGLAFMIVWVQ